MPRRRSYLNFVCRIRGPLREAVEAKRPMSRALLEAMIEKTQKKVNRLVETKEYQERKLELFNEFINSL